MLLGIKLQHKRKPYDTFFQTGALSTLLELNFLVFFAMHWQSQGLDKCKTFKSSFGVLRLESRLLMLSWVLTSRLELRLWKFESSYWDWIKDSKILSLDIKTGIKTFEIMVLISRLVSRQSGDPWDWDSCESHWSSLKYMHNI